MTSPDLTSTIQRLIEQESLPNSYAATVRTVILPLAQHIQSLQKARRCPIVVGIHGAQGTGKSTLTLFLRELLTVFHHVPTASFSIDDLYLTRAERETLAQDRHPLFITRGVPGTHDLGLGQRLIDRLKSAGPDSTTPVPVFDKSRDDRAAEPDWLNFNGPADVILMEGWCVGALPTDTTCALSTPINRLEVTEDSDGVWRKAVNDHLKGAYASFFDQIDCLIMLKAPSMTCVHQWRTLQEHKLKAKHDGAPKEGGKALDHPERIMSDDQITRFIMHYERITRACLDEMPGRADALIHVGEDHAFSEPLIRQRQ